MPNINQFIGQCCGVSYIKQDKLAQATVDERREARLQEGLKREFTPANVPGRPNGLQSLLTQTAPQLPARPLTPTNPLNQLLQNAAAPVLRPMVALARPLVTLLPGPTGQRLERMLANAMAFFLSGQRREDDDDVRAERHERELKDATEGDWFNQMLSSGPQASTGSRTA